MGKSALPLVLSQMEVVKPSKGGQPAYVRSKRSIQTSAKLASFHSCVASKMTGTSGTRTDIRNKFGSAAKSCKK